MVEIAASIAWTNGVLTASGHIEWLETAQSQHEQDSPDGSALLAVHASVHRDDGPGITPDIPDEELTALFPDASADLVLGGHTIEKPTVS